MRRRFMRSDRARLRVSQDAEGGQKVDTIESTRKL